MVSKTRWEKEELLRVLNDVRGVLRCDIQRNLKIEKEKITYDINTKIKELEQKRYNILKENSLLNIDSGRCGCDIIPLHPKLKIFDENTNIKRKQILER